MGGRAFSHAGLGTRGGTGVICTSSTGEAMGRDYCMPRTVIVPWTCRGPAVIFCGREELPARRRRSKFHSGLDHRIACAVNVRYKMVSKAKSMATAPRPKSRRAELEEEIRQFAERTYQAIEEARRKMTPAARARADAKIAKLLVASRAKRRRNA